MFFSLYIFLFFCFCRVSLGYILFYSGCLLCVLTLTSCMLCPALLTLTHPGLTPPQSRSSSEQQPCTETATQKTKHKFVFTVNLLVCRTDCVQWVESRWCGSNTKENTKERLLHADYVTDMVLMQVNCWNNYSLVWQEPSVSFSIIRLWATLL